MDGINFIKMHGLGNDFVILDLRAQNLDLSKKAVRVLSERRTGIGFDQLITIQKAKSSQIDASIRIWNADGGEVFACGNAVRCVGYLLLLETGKDKVKIETEADILDVMGKDQSRIMVNMGEPKLDWSDIPLSVETDTLSLDISVEGLNNPVCVSMGNPHAVFFVDQLDDIDLESIGPKIEHHKIFPERANVSLVKIKNLDDISLRVWERGVGVTSACGTAACAAVVAGVRRGFLSRSVSVNLDGGSLEIEWRSLDNHVIMTGPVATSFRGTLV
tara:strand:- start:18004 stop:18825 length:822 start_codon:yes stop_codon:yes gene_type:complete